MKISTDKKELHPRNRHREPYNFPELIKSLPELGKFVTINKFNNESIDFSDPAAVLMLNRALLRHFYGIVHWSIPEKYLCPPIPGRAEYIHRIADLLSFSNHGILPPGKAVKVLDIGVGASCIYPILGNIAYGWKFVGSDIDPVAIKSAEQIIASNDLLKGVVDCRLQKTSYNIFKGIIREGELFDITVCNPPFHSSFAEARSGTLRKWKNLGIARKNNADQNFGGVFTELVYKGGEEAFVSRMIEESALFSTSVFWYSCLLSKSTSLPLVTKAVREAGVYDFNIIPIAHGNKVSRVVAWTFLTDMRQKEWRQKRWQVLNA